MRLSALAALAVAIVCSACSTSGRCTSNGDCQSGRCAEGECAPPAAVACTSGDQCSSGRCVGGECASTIDPASDAGAGAPDSGSGNPAADVWCAQGQGSCFCGVGGAAQPNALGCGPAQLIQPGKCCADPEWPSSGSCRCAVSSCSNDSSGCRCTLAGIINQAGNCSGTTCCAITSSTSDCSCENVSGPCYTGTAVSSCSAPTIPCDEGQVEVASCR